MPLPPLIEIEPLSDEQLAGFKEEKAKVTIPGSKSITNRAIVLAALGSGVVTLRGALWSEDTEAMCDCMERLGIEVKISPDPDVEANRILEVTGCSGKIPKAGTPEEPLELFVENAGTAARFLAAMVCLGNGCFKLSGVPRMHERPQAELLKALRGLGYQIDTPNDKLPAIFHGSGPRPGAVTVSVQESSQFASALLLSSRAGEWQVSIPEGANPDELPYVEMTRRLLEVFPTNGGTFQIEPDASSASYFHAVNAIFPDIQPLEVVACQPPKKSGGSGWQIDAEFPELAPVHGRPAKEQPISRKTDLGDSIMTGIAIAPLAASETTFVDLGVLRRQECERVEALRTELTKCGAKVTETGDTLVIASSDPGSLGNASVATYADHRMAMCLATLALAVRGVKIQDPTCVRKTFPSFFQVLAGSKPSGLGVKVWECDATSGERTRQLTDPADLFAAK